MIYKINITKRALKFIEKQNLELQKRIYKAIYNLPYGDVKKMKANEELYRLRVGEFRFIYNNKRTNFNNNYRC